MSFVFISGFLLGIIAILAAEAAGLMYIVKRLKRKRDRNESKPGSDSSTKDFNPRESVDFCLNKQVIDLNSSLSRVFARVFVLNSQEILTFENFNPGF